MGITINAEQYLLPSLTRVGYSIKIWDQNRCIDSKKQTRIQSRVRGFRNTGEPGKINSLGGILPNSLASSIFSSNSSTSRFYQFWKKRSGSWLRGEVFIGVLEGGTNCRNVVGLSLDHFPQAERGRELSKIAKFSSVYGVSTRTAEQQKQWE